MDRELKEIIFLNKLEALRLTKEYLGLYLISFFKDNINGKVNREILIEKLKEYYEITGEENRLMNILVENLDKIRNYDTLNDLLDNLDYLNEKSYLYYDGILKEYEDNMYFETLDRGIVIPRNFKTILENEEYLNEVKGLFLNDSDLEEYFSKYLGFDYLRENTKVINSELNEGMDFYGCYTDVNKENGTLERIRVCVPKISDLKSMCINVHEYKHGLDIFPFIGKVLPNVDYEFSAREEEKRYKKYLSKKLVK